MTTRKWLATTAKTSIAFQTVPGADEIGVVRDDLAYLRDSWTYDLTESRLRRDSTALRLLLLDGGGLLKRARSRLGLKGEPKVNSYDLQNVLLGVNKASLRCAYTGGVNLSGQYFAPGTFVDDFSGGFNSAPALTVVTNRLSNYLAAPAICVRGTLIQRREVLKYVCNKLGGAHFDNKRSKDVETILDAAAACGLYLGDEALNPAYLELAAIGQALLSSAEVMQPFDIEPIQSPL